MELIQTFISLFLHLDKLLAFYIQENLLLTYFMLFAIIFSETGFVITPFLPGDSLLFAAGTLAAISNINIWILIIIIPLAATTGNILNYFIGYWLGPKIFQGNNRFLSKKNLNKSHAFYEKYGGLAISICRFMPILRTFTPFVAGIAQMNFWKFNGYNLLGAVIWGDGFILLGYFFGNIPIIKQHFGFVVIGIIAISLLPIFYAVLKKKKD